MCSACGFPKRPGHWTDAGAETAGDRIRLQLARAKVLGKILTPYGLTARPPGQVPGFALSTFDGKTQIVPDLEALWGAASQQMGAPIDPLASRFTDPV